MAVWQWGMDGGLWERGGGWYAVASGRACMTGRFMRVSETDNTPALHAGGLGSIPRPATRRNDGYYADGYRDGDVRALGISDRAGCGELRYRRAARYRGTAVPRSGVDGIRPGD